MIQDNVDKHETRRAFSRVHTSVFMSTKLIIETSDVGLNEGVQSNASRSDDPTY